MGDDYSNFNDALSRLVDEARAKNNPNLKPSLGDLKEGLVDKLPEPYPHDDEGFAHSFDVEEAVEIKDFFDKCVEMIYIVCVFLTDCTTQHNSPCFFITL